MTIDEIRKRQLKLRQDIEALVQVFEGETGTVVTAIEGINLINPISIRYPYRIRPYHAWVPRVAVNEAEEE